MAVKDKISNAAEEMAAKAKVTIGRVAGDRDVEAEGVVDEAVAKGKKIVEQVKDSAKETVDKIQKIAQ